MSLIVQKYGGSSVADPERILNVARRVIATQEAGHQVVVVVSAMQGVTDNLIRLSKEVAAGTIPPEREMDVLLATGEQTTISLLAIAIRGLGRKATSLTGAQAGIVTDNGHTRAKIRNIGADHVRELLADGNIVVVAGFQGVTESGQTTTLGRGGSDLTAIAIASAVKADICQIYTDVEGVFTCDPRIVKNARKLDELSYDEMLEMASSGSKVMQSRSVEFAKKFGVPFEVRSSFTQQPGTIVKEETMSMEQVVIRGVSIERNQAKVTLTHVADTPGTASRIFTAIADAGIVVDMIVQNVSLEGATDISFTLNKDELPKTRSVIDPLVGEVCREIVARDGIAKLSVVGIGMRSHSGVAAKLFEALGSRGINIQMISTSEIKIAVVINEPEAAEAANTVHEWFELAGKPDDVTAA